MLLQAEILQLPLTLAAGCLAALQVMAAAQQVPSVVSSKIFDQNNILKDTFLFDLFHCLF